MARIALVLGTLVLPAAGVALGLDGAARAEDVVIRIEAKRAPDAARAAAEGWSRSFPDVVTFPLKGGWTGIALGPMPREQAEPLLAGLKAAARIPADSFVTPAADEDLRPVPPAPAALPDAALPPAALPDAPGDDATATAEGAAGERAVGAAAGAGAGGIMTGGGSGQPRDGVPADLTDAALPDPQQPLAGSPAAPAAAAPEGTGAAPSDAALPSDAAAAGAGREAAARQPAATEAVSEAPSAEPAPPPPSAPQPSTPQPDTSRPAPPPPQPPGSAGGSVPEPTAGLPAGADAPATQAAAGADPGPAAAPAAPESGPAAGAAPGSAFLRLASGTDADKARAALDRWRQVMPEAGLWTSPRGRHVVALGPLTPQTAEAWLGALRAAGLASRDASVVQAEDLGRPEIPGSAPALGAPPAPDAGADAPATRMPPLEDVQRALRWAGHYAGPIDGKDGPMTRAAIARAVVDLRASPDPAAAMHELLARRAAWRERMGLIELRDAHTGLALPAPMQKLQFDRAQRALSIYGPRDGSGAALILLSQPGGQQEMLDLAGLVTALGWVPAPTRSIRRGQITLDGQNDTHVAHAEARIVDGRVQGFVLIWPVQQADEQRRLAAEMSDHLTRFAPGAAEIAAGTAAGTAAGMAAGGAALPAALPDPAPPSALP